MGDKINDEGGGRPSECVDWRRGEDEVSRSNSQDRGPRSGHHAPKQWEGSREILGRSRSSGSRDREFSARKCKVHTVTPTQPRQRSKSRGRSSISCDDGNRRLESGPHPTARGCGSAGGEGGKQQEGGDRRPKISNSIAVDLGKWEHSKSRGRVDGSSGEGPKLGEDLDETGGGEASDVRSRGRTEGTADDSNDDRGRSKRQRLKRGSLDSLKIPHFGGATTGRDDGGTRVDDDGRCSSRDFVGWQRPSKQCAGARSASVVNGLVAERKDEDRGVRETAAVAASGRGKGSGGIEDAGEEQYSGSSGNEEGGDATLLEKEWGYEINDLLALNQNPLRSVSIRLILFLGSVIGWGIQTLKV